MAPTDRQRKATNPLAFLATVAGLGTAAALTLHPMAKAQATLPRMQIPLYEITAQGTGMRLGSLRFSETTLGLVVEADVRGLVPGANSLHLHQWRSCDPAVVKGQLLPGAGAGPHWDPTGVMGHGVGVDGSHGSHGAHGGTGALPLGDLPDLIANADGISTSVVAAPWLKSLNQIRGRSVIVHRGPNGPKFACGVLPP
jgi:Cu-Zn family superoxide dismutase